MSFLQNLIIVNEIVVLFTNLLAFSGHFCSLLLLQLFLAHGDAQGGQQILRKHGVTGLVAENMHRLL